MKEKLWIGRNYKVKKKKVEEEQLISLITGGALVWDMQVSMGSESCLGTEVPKPLFLRPSWLTLLGLSCVHIYVIHLRSPWATLPEPLTGPDPPGSHCCPKSPTAAPVSVWAVVHPFWQVLSFLYPRDLIQHLAQSKHVAWGFPSGSAGKESVCNAGDTGDLGLIPRWGKSSAEGNGNPLQYFCQENPMDRRAWRATI